MAEHSDLVAEIASVEKMTTPERLKHAKKRRSQQLKRYANYEKQLEKDKNKKHKQSQNQKRQQRKRARVKFIHNIMLLEAASRNDVDEVKRLLMSGVSPDVTNEDGLTALHQCCIDDSEDMLKLLLEFGANVNAKDSEMWTPLHAAATCGHVHLCKCLIDKGAELLAVNADGNMPYDICEDEMCLDFIETEMAKRGVTQEEIDEKRLETEKQMLSDLRKLASEKRNLEYRGEHRATPLHIAAANGYLDVVKFLLDHRVSMEMRDEDGWLPIHAAACWLQPEVIEMLVKNGADLDAKTRTGETAFDLAEDPDVKQKILDLKDELETHRNTKDNKGHVQKKRATSRGASIRRTSMRGDKRPLFKKEAKEEALHFGMMNMNNDDDDFNDIDDEKENVPATNIDDVKIIIDDDIDKYDKPPAVNRNSVSSHGNRSSQEVSARAPTISSNNNNNRNSYTEKTTAPPKAAVPDKQQKPTRESVVVNEPQQQLTPPRTEQSVRSSDSQKRTRQPEASEKRKSEGGREPIHIQMERVNSGSRADQQRSSSSPREREREQKESAETRSGVPAVHPQTKLIQGQANIGRTPSFTKKRDSVRRGSKDHTAALSVNPNQNNTSPSGTGTLADLKKQRLESHKIPNSVEAQIGDLFLSSLGDNKKYSGSSPKGPQQNPKSENTQNGRTSNNVNNNNKSVPPRPPVFLSDSGPLRKYSAPTSSPAVGEDDKFKSNCCTIL